ncbi:MAG: glutathione peroxidase [Saprospiraceae bacterium]|nr:glutathione peroxidase [Saprospiraceae bacterium]
MNNIYDIRINNIHFQPMDLRKFEGKKLLIVNVASACGYTPQYAQLQELKDNFEDKLEILGCPCNDFGGQEPGDESSILEFCTTRYAVGFPLTQKIGIRTDMHPLYQWLCKKEYNGVSDAEVRWNFHKFLIDENGKWLAEFSSSVSPLDDVILQFLG